MRVIVIFLLVVSFATCGRTEDPINRIINKLNIDGNSEFKKYLPKVYNDSSIYWQMVRKERNKIGLKSLENGSKDFEIRVWEELKWGRSFFILRYNDSIWTAEEYIYKTLYKDGNDIDSIAINIVRLGEPKSGWNNFLNRIIDKGILDLKDYSNIPGYYLVTDLREVAVEIAAKNYYRFYQLPGPEDQPKNIKDAMAMSEILDIIKSEFPSSLRSVRNK